ncbi:hypothetical protein D3C86_1150580 [compost metagenome]
MGIQCQKVGLAMFALIDAHVVQTVRQGKLFKRNGCLEAIGGTVGIEMQHRIYR